MSDWVSGWQMRVKTVLWVISIFIGAIVTMVCIAVNPAYLFYLGFFGAAILICGTIYSAYRYVKYGD